MNSFSFIPQMIRIISSWYGSKTELNFCKMHLRGEIQEYKQFTIITLSFEKKCNYLKSRTTGRERERGVGRLGQDKSRILKLSIHVSHMIGQS